MVLECDAVVKAAQKKKMTVEQVWYRFVLQMGINILNGTKDPVHIKQDLELCEDQDTWREDCVLEKEFF